MTLAVKLRATGAHLPGAPIDNETIERLAGPLPEDVLDGLEVKTRHWMVDPKTGEHRESNSQMAAHAAANALKTADMDPQDVDLLVVATSSPEYHLPAMVTQVQDRLGLERCGVLELRSGCCGFVQALELARLQLERGYYRRAVVIGSESISPLLVPIYKGRDPSTIRMRDRIPAYAFGDGAGAAVLEAEEGEGGDFIGYAAACVGGGKKAGMMVVGGGTHAPVERQLAAPRLVELKLDVVESARFTPTVLKAALEHALASSGLTAEQVDAVVVPEGNAGYLLDQMQSEGAPDAGWGPLRSRLHENLAAVAATGSAAVPLALDEAWRRGSIGPGALTMLLALETSKWLYATSLVRWSAPAPGLS